MSSGSDSGSQPWFSIDSSSSSSSSSSGSHGGGSDGGGGSYSGSGSGGPGTGCPDITDITVTLYSIGDLEEFPLCFQDDSLTPCHVVVGFTVEPFDPDCADHLIARVTMAGQSKTISISSAGGFYQVEWGTGFRLNLFPDSDYTVEVCLERTLGTPETCDVPAGCCSQIQWTSPAICDCNFYITDITVDTSGMNGSFLVVNLASTALTVTGYNGPGTVGGLPPFPAVIPGEGSQVFYVEYDAPAGPGVTGLFGGTFTIETTPCLESDEYTYPES
ncbi:MAG: hypothetical protein LLG20_22665 [Acidobacteriales bacterium]|nr:hypothetical protein [Terriglobales bacterium]